MAFNFDGSYSLDQGGLELTLNDFSFDSTQQQLQQQQLQQQQQQGQQQELHNMLLQDNHSNSINQTQLMDEDPSTPRAFDFHPSALNSDMLTTASASTTPIFPVNPDKVNLVNTSLQQQLQQQQQQMFLQQQQQQQHQQQQEQFNQQQQNIHQQQLQQQQPQQQIQSLPTSQPNQLLTPAGSEYYSTDYTQYMSPLAVQPDTTSDAAMMITDQFEDDEVFFTPLISPAMTPSHPYSNLTHALSTANEIFSPLTSPALQPHRTSIDYLSFSGQTFSQLPTQFHQAQTQQQHLQHHLHQLQSQPQPELAQQSQQQQASLQLQQQQQIHTSQPARSPALNSQRPSMKRRTTAERVNGLNSTTPRTVGPVRGALPKSSPALRPLTNPMSPATLRKQQANRSKSSSIAPASPLIMHFPTRPSPSPLLISTSQPSLSQAAQASPSPRLVTNMHQLSMVPSSPMAMLSSTNGSKSPALFALPASHMMPPPSSPMMLPSGSTQMNNTPRQRSLAHPQQPIQIQSQHQLSIHQPISALSQPFVSSPALQAIADSINTPSAPIAAPVSVPASAAGSVTNETAAASPISATTNGGTVSAVETPKSALAPVTPASLMNLGAGSGTESTPSSPKFGVHGKTKQQTAGSPSRLPPNANNDSAASTKSAMAPSVTAQKRGTKRQANGDAMIAAPSTPRQLALTPGTAAMSPMAPPPNGFALISPALKPTLMPQHRGSQSILVSPRLQPQLVSPSLKPWLPGVSTNEAMARLASRSNYQNILDGDHTALGLSYNTDLHSGIELRRTSHKAAEQKRRDSLKHCFDDLRNMIPSIQEKSPSKVFLLKKSFDYICNLKCEVAKRDLEMARLKAQHEFMKNAMQSWMVALPENSPIKKQNEDLLASWTMPEDEIEKATTKEQDVARRAEEVAELSAAAVEAARTQPGGQNKGGKDSSQADLDDSDDDEFVAPKTNKKANTKSIAALATVKGGNAKKVGKTGAAAGTPATTAAALGSSDVTMQQQQESSDTTRAGQTSASGAQSNRSSDEEDEEEEEEDQEMTDATTTAANE